MQCPVTTITEVTPTVSACPGILSPFQVPRKTDLLLAWQLPDNWMTNVWRYITVCFVLSACLVSQTQPNPEVSQYSPGSKEIFKLEWCEFYPTVILYNLLLITNYLRLFSSCTIVCDCTHKRQCCWFVFSSSCTAMSSTHLGVICEQCWIWWIRNTDLDLIIQIGGITWVERQVRLIAWLRPVFV